MHDERTLEKTRDVQQVLIINSVQVLNKLHVVSSLSREKMSRPSCSRASFRVVGSIELKTIWRLLLRRKCKRAVRKIVAELGISDVRSEKWCEVGYQELQNSTICLHYGC